MGSFLSCASLGDPYKGSLDYSVTFKAQNDARIAREASLYRVCTFQANLISDSKEFKGAVKGMETSKAYLMNNNKEIWMNPDISGYMSGKFFVVKYTFFFVDFICLSSVFKNFFLSSSL